MRARSIYDNKYIEQLHSLTILDSTLFHEIFKQMHSHFYSKSFEEKKVDIFANINKDSKWKEYYHYRYSKNDEL